MGERVTNTFVCSICGATVLPDKGNSHVLACDTCFDEYFQESKEQARVELDDRLNQLRSLKRLHYQRVSYGAFAEVESNP